MDSAKDPEETKFPIMEIFGPTIQGEGALAGIPTHFVRLGGCTYRCSWCDTMFAVDPQQVKAGRTMMTPREIVGALGLFRSSSLTTQWVTLSGGDPMMQKYLNVLTNKLMAAGWKVAIETQGAIWHGVSHFPSCNFITISPKPPSSGMETDYDVLQQYLGHLRFESVRSPHPTQYAIKVVIFDRDDLKYAADLVQRLDLSKIYLQVGTNIEDPDRNTTLDAYELIIKDVTKGDLFNNTGAEIVILPQIHSLLWGNQRGK